MNNRTLLSKAAVDTSTLGNGGKMNPEQSSQFITFMKDYSAFLRSVDFISMLAPRRQLDYGDVGKRNMRKQLENLNNPPTGTFTTKQRELVSVGVVMAYDITFSFMKENIEKGNINNTLAKLFAQQYANDCLDMGFNGDESSSDPFLSINNGWLKLFEKDSDVHKHDNVGITDMAKLFSELLSLVPSKYFQMYQQEDKNDLKILVSHKDNREYKEQLQKRNTALGDSILISGQNVKYDGFEIIPCGFMPEGTRVVTPLKNLAYGVYGSSMEVYHEVVPRQTRHEYTLLGDFDFEIHNPDVVVASKDRTSGA